MGVNTTKTADILWKSAPKSEVRWLDWGDGFVAFHRPSGTTHLLNASSKLLIEEILGDPIDAHTIAEEYAQIVPVKDPDAHLQDIWATLVRLDELGLIQRL